MQYVRCTWKTSHVSKKKKHGDGHVQGPENISESLTEVKSMSPNNRGGWGAGGSWRCPATAPSLQGIAKAGTVPGRAGYRRSTTTSLEPLQLQCFSSSRWPESGAGRLGGQVGQRPSRPSVHTPGLTTGKSDGKEVERISPTRRGRRLLVGGEYTGRGPYVCRRGCARRWKFPG